MIRKVFYINIALFALVVVMVGFLMTEDYPIPPKPPVEMWSAGPQEDATIDPEQGTDPYANLGKTPIFDTIYPKPTPIPTPVPTDPPDPELDKATDSWTLISTLPGGIAMFEDTRTKDDWMMNIGEVHPVKYRNATLDVKLKSTNESEFSATISYTGKQGEQTRVLKMFD